MKQFTVLNLGHPLTDAQQVQLRIELAGQLALSADTIHLAIRTVRVQIDFERPLSEQIAAIVDDIGWNSDDWQATPFLLRLPGMADAAAAVIAEIHGRAGYFPSIVTLKRVGADVPPVFDIWDVVPLQTVRDKARARREVTQ